MTEMPSGEFVLVTGGAGFIGQHVAARLVAGGARVRALDVLNPQVHRSPEIAVSSFPGDVRVGDVRDADAVADAMRGVSAVVHLAAETGVGQSMYETERYTTVNVDGTRTVLAEAQRRGAPVVVASSRAVYGLGAHACAAHGRTYGEPCCTAAEPANSREDDPLTPVSVYGETKADAERLAASFAAQGTPVAVIRPQNVIGAGQALHNPYTGVLAAFAARLRRGLPPQVYAPGLQTRDFVAVEDVAAAIAWLLDDAASWPRHPVLNVGSGTRVTLRELATTACAAAGAPDRIEFVEITRPGDIDHACADVSRARSAGMPAPQVPFSASVADFIRFAAEQDPVDPGIWDHALEELAALEQHE